MIQFTDNNRQYSQIHSFHSLLTHRDDTNTVEHRDKKLQHLHSPDLLEKYAVM